MNSNYIFPINLGSEEELSIINLAELVRKKINQNIKIKYMEKFEEEPMNRKPDIRLAKKLLNWESKIRIEKGIELTIDYYKNQK